MADAAVDEEQEQTCSPAKIASVAQEFGCHGPTGKNATDRIQAIAQSMARAATRRPSRAIERGPDDGQSEALTGPAGLRPVRRGRSVTNPA